MDEYKKLLATGWAYFLLGGESDYGYRVNLPNGETGWLFGARRRPSGFALH